MHSTSSRFIAIDIPFSVQQDEYQTPIPGEGGVLAGIGGWGFDEFMTSGGGYE